MRQVHIIFGDADTDVFLIASCQNCTPVLPIPFDNKADRAVWVARHIVGTGHEVTVLTEIRVVTP